MQFFTSLCATLLLALSCSAAPLDSFHGLGGTPAHLLPELRASLLGYKWTHGSHVPNRKVLQSSSGVSLLDAVKREDFSAVENLLDEGADPNYTTDDGVNPLLVAILNDYGQMVKLLVDRGADLDGSASSHVAERGALNIAALYDSGDAASALIKLGAPIDGFNDAGLAPLHYAAARGSVNAAKVLLDSGANVNIESPNDGETPLHFAIIFEHLSMVRLLLISGADVNAQYGERSDTPLHVAARFSTGIIISELLSYGAIIDAQDSKGGTPLFDAAVLGAQGAIEVLVLNGADKTIVAYDLTPREALCACIEFDDIPDSCNEEGCENPQRMEQLLT